MVTRRSDTATVGICVLMALVLAACSSSTSSRYSQKHDAAPPLKLDPNRIDDAVPRHEPIKAAGNMSPYKVLGKKYWVMSEKKARKYNEKGTASWYGTKFHGHLTSNGETYNMYKMTAAHKSLPIPSYVKVTNLSNGRTAIVRVNDRGPFHSDRIIDLSYAAATKLGYHNKGTAKVRVEYIDAKAWAKSNKKSTKKVKKQQVAAKPAPTPAPAPVDRQPYLQAGAFSQFSAAESYQKQLVAVVDAPVTISSKSIDTGTLYRVRIGPFQTTEHADRVSALMVMQNLGKPHTVYD